jgi:hypothetical protein
MNEKDSERLRAFIESTKWTAAVWACETDARHEYVMEWDVDPDEYQWVVGLIKAEGYRAKWGPNPVTGKSYTNVYLEVGDWTYWWIPRCLNREHRSVQTLRSPATAADERDDYPPLAG